MLYNCEVANTHGNAIAANSQNTSELYFIDNRIHNTGGHAEGFYLGAHDGSIITHHSYIVGNWIYDLVGPTVNQGDGIEIKYGSYAVTVKNNFVRNTHYPGIMVYGAGQGTEDRNVIEENVVIGSHDYGMQISAEAIVQNNLVVGGGAGCFCSKPDDINPQYLTVVNNTFVNERKCVTTNGWSSPRAVEIVFANNALFAGNGLFIQNGTGNAVVAANVELKDLSQAFVNLDLTGSAHGRHAQSRVAFDRRRRKTVCS